MLRLECDDLLTDSLLEAFSILYDTVNWSIKQNLLPIISPNMPLKLKTIHFAAYVDVHFLVETFLRYKEV